jgi:hypothetical protein
MDNATPKVRDFQPNDEDLEPYKTPVIMKHQRLKRKVIEDSDTETHMDVTEDRRIKTRNVSETKVCRACVDHMLAAC